ncbi:hypothetical protein V496_02811 [Pseudogymnoascus sp. VKM F-4515 (FW-2607)]|nr:hypothetical protein V496_02811 [Pseudogymnoascus sp. VKM F-4515 (FW-2607)]KFZ00451.1 hypothetical protein V498_00075 [Pseudogymnoascus sp. VKM F-4517 (FW-2822)]
MVASANAPLNVLPRSTNCLIRISFFFTKIPSMSQSQFESHWRDTHGRLAIATKAFREAQIQQYTQIHNDKSLTKRAAELFLPLVEFDWDACSEMYVKSWEDYLVFATSDEARDILGPDGALIMHPDKGLRIMVSRVDPMYIKSAM